MPTLYLWHSSTSFGKFWLRCCAVGVLSSCRREFIYPPRLTTVSVLPGEILNAERAPFYLKTEYCFTNNHETFTLSFYQTIIIKLSFQHIQVITCYIWTTLHYYWVINDLSNPVNVKHAVDADFRFTGASAHVERGCSAKLCTLFLLSFGSAAKS